MIPHNKVCLRSEDEYVLSGVVRSGQLAQGPHLSAFEDELAERFRPGGAAACVSSGTAALRLAAIALDPDGETVWTVPTYACTALLHALDGSSAFGVMRVAMADCTAGTLNAPQATVIVHTYGVPCPVPEGTIEDFTHAPGAEIEDKPCGSFGAASVISFGATKPLGCGVGGAVLGPPDLIEAVKDMRDYDGKRDLRPRFNWQMGELTAALGRQRLARLDEENTQRFRMALLYLAICQGKGLHVYGYGSSTYYRFVVRVPDPADAIQHFAEHGVQVINPLRTDELLHRQLGLPPEDFPVAEDAAQHTISLPIWPGMAEVDVTCVVEALKGLTL